MPEVAPKKLSAGAPPHRRAGVRTARAMVCDARGRLVILDGQEGWGGNAGHLGVSWPRDGRGARAPDDRPQKVASHVGYGAGATTSRRGGREGAAQPSSHLDIETVSDKASSC